MYLHRPSLRCSFYLVYPYAPAPLPTCYLLPLPPPSACTHGSPQVPRPQLAVVPRCEDARVAVRRKADAAHRQAVRVGQLGGGLGQRPQVPHLAGRAAGAGGRGGAWHVGVRARRCRAGTWHACRSKSGGGRCARWAQSCAAEMIRSPTRNPCPPYTHTCTHRCAQPRCECSPSAHVPARCCRPPCTAATRCVGAVPPTTAAAFPRRGTTPCTAAGRGEQAAGAGSVGGPQHTEWGKRKRVRWVLNGSPPIQRIKSLANQTVIRVGNNQGR